MRDEWTGGWDIPQPKKGPPMTQSKSKLGITPGECELWGMNKTTEVTGFEVIGPRRPAPTAYVASYQDAKLYADAHNVANRTGLTPGELERERNDALKANIQDRQTIARLTAANAGLVKALELIAADEESAGKTTVKELQNIATKALAAQLEGKE